jgi:hypothetical protein
MVLGWYGNSESNPSQPCHILLLLSLHPLLLLLFLQFRLSPALKVLQLYFPSSSMLQQDKLERLLLEIFLIE